MPESYEIPTTWTDLDETEIVFSNQFLSQFIQQEFIVSFGQVAPPPIFGTPQQQEQLMKRVQFVPIKTVARLAFTRARLQELVTVLQQNLDNYDRAHREG